MKRKILSKAILCIIAFLIIILGMQVSSEAASFSASASSTSLTVGGTTSLSITASGCGGKFTVSSSDSSIVSVGESSIWVEDTTSSITLTAKKAGTATITVTAANVADTAGENDITGSKTVTITVSSSSSSGSSSSGSSSGSSSSSSTKSSDATLKSLTVGGKSYSNPSTDITVSSVSASTSTITILATANSSKASISGTGTKDLVTGTNKFTITVTAEDGTTKSYIIRVTKLAEESTVPNVIEETEEEGGEEETELRLSSLVVQDVELVPEFDSEVFEYAIDVVDLDELVINAVANMEDALVEITGNTELIEGKNTVIITLTKDETVVEYKITVNKTVTLAEEPEQEEQETEEEEEKNIAIIGIITDWWDKSGPMTVVISAILILLAIATIFAITTYKYTNNVREVSKHAQTDYAEEDMSYEEDMLEDDNEDLFDSDDEQ